MAVDTIARALALKAEGGNTPPDLSNYVQFSDFATQDKAGVINSGSNGFSVDASGNTSADVYTSEQYGGLGDNSFISKGTLENIKDDYVGSSQPVQDLTSTVTNIQEEQDENIPKNNAEGTDNVFDDGLESPLFALGGDGKSEQVVTTGANLLNYLNVKQFVSNGLVSTINNDGSITTSGTPTKQYVPILESINITDILEDGQTYTIMQKNATNKLYIQVTIITNSDEISYIGLNNNTQNIKAFTVDKQNNKTYSINIQSNTIETTGELNITNYYQLLKGSYDEWQPFEKYTGGQPSPSSDYPQPINSIEGSLEFECRGKNEFDFNKFASAVSNVYIVEGTPENLTIKQNSGENGIYDIDFKENTQYKFSGKVFNSNANCSMRVIYTDGSNSSLFALYDNTTLNKNFSVTTIKGKTVLYILINIYGHGQTIELKDFMISQDLTDTNYVYQEPNEVTFNLNDEKLRSVGDVKDELVVDLDTGDYYKFKNVEHLELAIANMNNISEDYPGWLNIEKLNDYFPNTNNTINTLAKIKSNITTNGMTIGINTIEQSILWLEKGKFNLTQTQWKEQYPDLIFKLDYSIPSTETIKLGTLSSEDLAKLKTFKGYNNVTVNTNLGFMNIRFTYGLDIKKYVDNKIAQLSEQLIKGE